MKLIVVLFKKHIWYQEIPLMEMVFMIKSYDKKFKENNWNTQPSNVLDAKRKLHA